MYCAHCGKEVPDDTVFCEFCGKKTTEDDAAMAADSKKKGKAVNIGAVKSLAVKGKKWILLAAVLLVLVLLIPAAPYIFNGLKKLTTSPEKYCQYVLKKNIVDSKMISGAYDKYIYEHIKNQNNAAISGEVSMKLSEDAQEMLEDSLRADNMEAFSDLKISYETQKKGDQLAWQIKLSSGKKSIMTGNVIYDGDKKAIYVNIPEVNKNYAKVELEDVLDEDELEDLDLIFKNTDKWAEAFPEPKDVQKMLERYMMIAINEIDSVKESKEKLEIEGVTQSCTALSIKVDEKMVKNIVLAMCKEAVSDRDLEKLITSAMDIYLETGMHSGYYGYYSDGADFWDDMERIGENAKDIDFYGWKYEVKLFVSGAGKIQGVEFTSKNSDRDAKGRIYTAYARSGNKVAATCVYENSGSWSDEKMEITGEGKVSFGKLNADFEVKTTGNDKASFRVENLKIAGLAKGKLEGDLVMELKQFKDEMKDELSDLKDQTLRISLLTDANNVKYEISLKEEKETFVSLSVSIKFGKAGSISIPSDSKCDVIGNEEDLADYIDNCDFDTLADTLEDLGMPNELVEMIENGGGLPRYIQRSKVAADTQLADSIHTAVLTSMMDPEIVNRKDYNDAIYELEQGIDITQYTGDENGVLWGTAEILGVDDLHELSDQIKSAGATGRIWVTVTGSYNLEVVIEGTDCGNGTEITVR